MRLKVKQLRQMIREACVSGEMGDWHGETHGRELGDGGSAAMARGQLFTAAQKAQSLYDRLTDEDEIPEWVQSKINTVDDYMSSIEDYLGYKMHRHDMGDPLPAHEARRRSGRSLREAEATVGEKVKGGAPLERLEKMLDRLPGLDAVLKQIDTRDELEALVQAIVAHAIETGGLEQSEVNAALQKALAAAKKG
jgi:Tfp pilus assembly protein PilO